jgi:hypothetical protein
MPNKAKAERVYYMVTRAGLHVGQNASKGGLFGRSAAVDHFLPRESIVGSDTDHQDAVQIRSSGQSSLSFGEGQRRGRCPSADVVV